MSIQVGVSEMFALLPHDHTSIAEGGKLLKYSSVFEELDLIANILADHNKTLHDAMNIDAESVDGEHSDEIVTIGRVEDTFPSWNPAVHSKAVHDALGIDADTVDTKHIPGTIAQIISDHNKALHDTLGLDHAQLSNILSGQHHAQLHAAAHKVAGGDAIKIDELAVPDDNTLLNVLTTKHGLCPKLPNDAAKFLDGLGSWVVPSGGGFNVKVLTGTRDLTAGSGAIDYTGTTFTPKCVIGMGTEPDGGSLPIFSMGVADGSTQGCVLFQADTVAVGKFTDKIFVPRPNTANHQTAAFNAFLGNGVRLTWAKVGTPTGTFKFILICLG